MVARAIVAPQDATTVQAFGTLDSLSITPFIMPTRLAVFRMVQTCLTAMLKRGGNLNSVSTAANRSALPLLTEISVLVAASHRTWWSSRLRRCRDVHGPELKACMGVVQLYAAKLHVSAALTTSGSESTTLEQTCASLSALDCHATQTHPQLCVQDTAFVPKTSYDNTADGAGEGLSIPVLLAWPSLSRRSVQHVFLDDRSRILAILLKLLTLHHHG